MSPKRARFVCLGGLGDLPLNSKFDAGDLSTPTLASGDGYSGRGNAQREAEAFLRDIYSRVPGGQVVNWACLSGIPRERERRKHC